MEFVTVTIVELEPGRWVGVIDDDANPFPHIWASPDDWGMYWGYDSVDQALGDIFGAYTYRGEECDLCGKLTQVLSNDPDDSLVCCDCQKEGASR